MTKSMTEGSPIRLIMRFMLPLLAGNLFQQLYNIVDGAIVGQILGAQALGAVGASSSVQFLVLGFCTGMCTGFAIPVAQSFGAQRYHDMRMQIYNGILLTIILGAVVTLLTSVFCTQIIRLLQTPEDIFHDAYLYLLIIFLGIPFTLLYNFTASILRAVGDSRTPFLFLSISTVLNIFLDLFCILVLGWGVAGAAIATISSQALSGMLCTIYILHSVRLLSLQPEDKKITSQLLGRLTLMGVPMGLQFSITAIGSMVMQSANNSLGSVYVSAFTAGVKIKQFTLSPYDALATAVSTFAGQNYGAGKYKRICRGIREGLIIGVSYGILIGIVMILFGSRMCLIFLPAQENQVIDAAAQYLRCMGYFHWALAILNVMRVSMQGLGYTGRAIFSGVVEMFARSFVAIVFVPLFGYTAICWTDQAAWIAAALYNTPMMLVVLRRIRREFTEKGISLDA